MVDSLNACRRLVVSPHLDDGVLSCGGALAAWAQAGERPVVVTVCAGRPAGRLSAFAQFQHARWGEGVDLVGRRRAEDEQALAQLGAVPLWLDYLDCIYRDNLYITEESLFGPLAAAEEALSERLGDELLALWRRTAVASVYLPLGLGNHVDHQLVRLAGRGLAAASVPLAWYEDFPYAVRPGGIEQRQRLTVGQRPELVPIAATLEQKIRAIAAYASQVPVLFDGADRMPASVRDYALAVGEGEAAERYWYARSI